MFPIMLQIYNVREELKKDFENTLKEIADMGYQYVELAMAQSFGKTSSQFKSALDNAGLKAISAHVDFRSMVANPDSVIGFHIDIGCEFIAVPYLIEEDRCTSPNYEKVKEEIAKLGEYVKKRGTTFLYHNHDFEFKEYRGKYALDDLYESIPASILQSEIDVCWTKFAGLDPVNYILKYSGRAPIVHLKDFDPMEVKKDAPFPFRALGEGVQNIPEIIKACEKAKTQWLVVEQDMPSPNRTALECAHTSLNYLNSLKV